MKKTYIALAASAAFVASGVAAAEVSVGVNQQLQVVNYSYDEGDAADGLYMNDGGLGFSNSHTGGGWSRISFKGDRDLGNGMNAFVQVDTNQGAFGDIANNTREVLAGLSGDFGRVRMGRVNTPYATGEPLQATFLQARGNGGRAGTINGLGNGSYRNGVVRYDNSFGGVKVDAALLVDRATDDSAADGAADDAATGGNHALSFKLSMPLGPVGAYVANTSANDYVGWDQSFSSDDQSLTKIGVTWASGPMSIQFEHESVSEGLSRSIDYDSTGDGTKDATYQAEDTHMFLSGTYDLSDASSVVLNYGQTTDGNDADADMNYMALGYIQSLGSGVRMHAGYRSSEQDWDNGETVTALGAGLRVSF